jgi:GWxTD domain-containing protein
VCTFTRRLVRSVLIAAVFGLGAGSAAGPAPAAADDLPPLRPTSPPFFTADPAISLDPTGHPTLVVVVSVPFTELQWLKISPGDRHAAHVEFTVVFEGKKGGRQYGDVWEQRAVVPSFGASRSPNNSLSDRRTFDLPAGTYRLRVRVRDLNGGMESNGDERIEVPDMSRVPVGFGDLELGVVDTSGVFHSTQTRRFGLDAHSMAARVSMFDRRAGDWPRTYKLRYRLLDEIGAELERGETEVRLAHSADTVVVRPKDTDLFVGDYTLVVEYGEGTTRWHVERSFEVEDSGPPRGKEFQDMLEPLSYIASANEIDHLRSLPPDQQAQGWNEFWRRRDPTPDTPRNEALIEFIRRVRYASRHFQGYGPGWRSDMGRIYIKYGAPEQTESHQATSTSPQLEIWYYTNPYRRFVFGDRDGFGRYVLMNGTAE